MIAGLLDKISEPLRGFFYRRRRMRLLEKMPKDSVCAEVGVWEGGFSDLILKTARPRKLYLIDPWLFLPELKEAAYGGAAARSQADMDAILDRVRGRFASEIRSGRVVILRGRSEAELAALEDGALDWVYIDGDHRREAVDKDLALALRKVKDSGCVAGDDYREGGWWEGGVKRAVDGCARKGGVRLTLLGTQFILERSGSPS